MHGMCNLQPNDPGWPGWNASIVAEIASNGGRNDVIVPLMWFAPVSQGSCLACFCVLLEMVPAASARHRPQNATSGWEDAGFLDYYAPCVSGRAYTTDAPFVRGGPPCGHLKTRNSSIGAVWTVSASIPQASQSLSGHKLGGAFMKKQFYDM